MKNIEELKKELDLLDARIVAKDIQLANMQPMPLERMKTGRYMRHLVKLCIKDLDRGYWKGLQENLEFLEREGVKLKTEWNEKGG